MHPSRIVRRRWADRRTSHSRAPRARARAPRPPCSPPAIDAVVTRETGGTAIGRRLRQVLHDNDVDDLDDRAEALIAAADRAQHLAEVVIPALDAGRPVVSDRSVYSTLAYQGYGRRLDLADLRRLNDWAVRGVWPDLVDPRRRPPGRHGRPAQRPRPRPLRAGRRRVPSAGPRRLPGAGPRRPCRGGR